MVTGSSQSTLDRPKSIPLTSRIIIFEISIFVTQFIYPKINSEMYEKGNCGNQIESQNEKGGRSTF